MYIIWTVGNLIRGHSVDCDAALPRSDHRISVLSVSNPAFEIQGFLSVLQDIFHRGLVEMHGRAKQLLD